MSLDDYLQEVLSNLASVTAAAERDKLSIFLRSSARGSGSRARDHGVVRLALTLTVTGDRRASTMTCAPDPEPELAQRFQAQALRRTDIDDDLDDARSSGRRECKNHR